MRAVAGSSGPSGWRNHWVYSVWMVMALNGVLGSLSVLQGMESAGQHAFHGPGRGEAAHVRHAVLDQGPCHRSGLKGTYVLKERLKQSNLW